MLRPMMIPPDYANPYRTCRFKDWNTQEMTEGYFHGWGLDHDSDSDNGQISVAIVECMDGTVMTPNAASIAFTDTEDREFYGG